MATAWRVGIVILGGHFDSIKNRRPREFAWTVAAADINHDGRIDLVVGGDARRNVALLLGLPNGGFAPARRIAAVGGEIGAAALEVGDVDDDRDPDVVVVGSDRVAILLGNGDGTFTPSISPGRHSSGRDGEPTDVELADVDRNGTLDLLLADTVNGVAVFLGNGDGTLRHQSGSHRRRRSVERPRRRDVRGTAMVD